jgi:uncharacterized membrane protein
MENWVKNPTVAASICQSNRAKAICRENSLSDNMIGLARSKYGARIVPDIIPLGWFHTATGIVALLSGVYCLAKQKEISLEQRAAQIYLLATLVTAATALGIFQHGEFGAAHGLAVLTLLALVAGTLAAITPLFGKFSRYVQAICYSATLLFHMIPAVTDFLLRLPVGNPILTSIEDPILKISYLALLVSYLVGLGFQLRWIHKQPTVLID